MYNNYVGIKNGRADVETKGLFSSITTTVTLIINVFTYYHHNQLSVHLTVRLSWLRLSVY